MFDFFLLPNSGHNFNADPMNIPFLTPLARASYEHEAISDILIPAASVTVLTLSSFWKPKKKEKKLKET